MVKWCYTYFTRNPDPRRDHQQIVLVYFVAPQALHLYKILLQIFLYEDLSTLAHTSVGCISPECQQDRTLLRNQYY